MDISQWIHDVEHTVPTVGSPAIALRSRTHRTGHRRRRSGESPIAGPIATHICGSYDHSHAGSREGLLSTTESQSSDGLSSSLSSPGYRRKPRRRTKADKYIIKQDRVFERMREEKKKSKNRSKRNSHKKHKSDHITELVQGFHAKNVPKDRLTLDPNRVGLYTKGRSSAPIRGHGLPDLVFSEMKFLHNREVNRADNDQERPAKQKRKKRGRELSEEEISAYFVPDAERRDERTSHREEQRQSRSIRQSKSPRRGPEQSAAADRADNQRTATPSVSLLRKPFLGFGSRGSLPRIACRGADSNSGRDIASPSRSFNQRVESLAIGQLQEISVAKQTTRDSLEDATPRNHAMSYTLVDARINECSGQKTDPTHGPMIGPVEPAQPSQSVDSNHQGTVRREDSSTKPDARPNNPAIDLKTLDIGEECAYKVSFEEEDLDDIMASLSRDGQANTSRREEKDGSYVRITSSPLGKLLRECDEVVRATTAISHQSPRPEQVWCPDYDHAGLQLWTGDNYQNEGPRYEDILQAERVNGHDGADQWQTYSPDEADRLVSDIPDSQVNVYDSAMLEHDCYSDEREDGERQNHGDVHHVTEDHNFEEFAGFWRPNKLY